MTDERDDERWGPAAGYLALALGIVGAALAAWWASTPSPAPAEPATAAAVAPSAAASAGPAAAPAVAMAASGAPPAAALARPPAPAASRIPRVREAGADPSPDIADYINDGEQPSTAEVIARLHAAGVHAGLGAFNPPGTRPPMVGLAVPADFALPPGYVRHYQVTDDGQPIEPILMFAPDYQPVGADGQPLPLSADRVVPPELAPPGLPIRRITIPAPINPH